MGTWTIVKGAGILLGSLGVLYGLHRLCSWLEDRGLLYYLKKKPDSSPASCFVALQQACEPQAKHILHVQEEKCPQQNRKVPGQHDATQDEPT